LHDAGHRRQEKPLFPPPFGVESTEVSLLEKLLRPLLRRPAAEHLRRGQLGERAARKHLSKAGLKFLTANFRSDRGEIDLIFRDADCLVFAEVKTRSSEDWTRPAAAVNAERRRRLSRCALDYLRLLKNPQVKIRFDIVEVLLTDGTVRDIRHLPNTFPMSHPYRYG
jgi:putative endonuclease